MAEKKLLILDTEENYNQKFDLYDVVYLSNGKIIENNCNILNFWNFNFSKEKKKLINNFFNYTSLKKNVFKNKNFKACLEINNFRNDRYKQYYKTLKILYLKKKLKNIIILKLLLMTMSFTTVGRFSTSTVNRFREIRSFSSKPGLLHVATLWLLYFHFSAI